MVERFIESELVREDPQFDQRLRPSAFDEFIGQEAVKERLRVLVEAARARGEPVGHCLFCGPPGLGKTTLGTILAKEMGAQLYMTSGPVIEKPGDLAGVLTNLKSGDVLFIDEIHRLSRAAEEYLYPAMEDYWLDLMIDSGPSARSVRVRLNPFTVVGATTRMGLLSGPLRSRFGMVCRVDYYNKAAVAEIVQRSAGILGFAVDSLTALEIARRARGTPRIANNLLRWVRDFAQTRRSSVVDVAVVGEALAMLDIDEQGLDELDKKILGVIIDHYGGGPVGLSTVSVAVSEDPSTIQEVHEPFLISEGFLERTPRGRKVTSLAYKHLGKMHLGNM